ncbi:MAG TPA: hypothetical protein VIH29_05680 [Gallionella sp.]
MKQTELKDQALRRAEELARSGKYPDWALIEHALKSEGYKKARIWLDDHFIRQELNDLCKRHYVTAPGKG